MSSALEEFELDLVLMTIEHRWGYDFRDYARASIRRRVKNTMIRHRIEHISELLPKILHDPVFFQDMVKDFSIPVTQMFRDTNVFRALVSEVFPHLRSWPFLKIWHAGCATGEEVYSLAILLHEAGLLERTTIYATDYNDSVLKIGKGAIYPIKGMKETSRHYVQSGGVLSLSEYFTSSETSVVISDKLRKNIVWANHNLVTDGVFGEMNLILCRNVMIYFAPVLRDRALNIFSSSLVRGGFLCLGNKESLDFTDVREQFDVFALKERLYRKKVDPQFVLPQALSPCASATNLDFSTCSRKSASRVVAIGGSMGGFKALRVILENLPENFPYPILVTLHITPDADSRMADLLQNKCVLKMKEAEMGEEVRAGWVYFAPPNYHLLLEGDRSLSFSSDDRVCYARPSIDVMFESVAESCGNQAIGVILTGANRDGAHGLAAIKAQGGYAIVQDPSTAESAIMPRAALDLSAVDSVVPLTAIHQALIGLAQIMPSETY